MKLVGLLLTTALLANADNRVANTYRCVSPAKNTLVASTRYGEIVVTNKFGKELANIDSTTGKVSKIPGGVKISFVHEEGSTVLTIEDKITGVEAFYYGEKYSCSKQ